MARLAALMSERRTAWRRASFSRFASSSSSEVLALLLGHQAHPKRAVGQRFEGAFGHQTPQRLAHRHGAGAQALGEAAHRHHLARDHVAGDQRLANRTVDLLGQRLPVLRGGGQRSVAAGRQRGLDAGG